MVDNRNIALDAVKAETKKDGRFPKLLDISFFLVFKM